MIAGKGFRAFLSNSLIRIISFLTKTKKILKKYLTNKIKVIWLVRSQEIVAKYLSVGSTQND